MYFLTEKQLGETCGACFSPQTGYECGKCANGLVCQPGDPQLPDAPGTCVEDKELYGTTLIWLCISNFPKKQTYNTEIEI